MPIVANTDLKIIALCRGGDGGMPETTTDRMKIAKKLVGGLIQNGVAVENIFLDPLVQPLSVNKAFAVQFLDAIEAIHNTWPGIHSACGLSNISYGLPGRKFINRAFMTMAIS